MKKSFYPLILSTIIGISSCNNDFDSVSSQNHLETKTMNISTGYAPQELAKALAKIVQNESVREYIKSEVSKQKDGDFDILVAEILDTEIPQYSTNQRAYKTHTIRESLINETTKLLTEPLTDSYQSSSIAELLRNIEINYPTLQIAIPNLDVASWDEITSGNKPFLVAFLDENYDDMSGESILAYDQDGKEYSLDGKQAPKEPVIVISESERILAVSNAERSQYTELNEYYKTANFTYLKEEFVPLENDLKDMPLEKKEKIDSYKAQPYSSSSFRATHPNYTDFIWKAQLPTSENYESWAKGRPEIAVRVVFYGNSLPAKDIKYNDKYWAKHNQRILNSEIIKWNSTSIGEYIAYSWREVDGGEESKKIDISFPAGKIFPALSFKISIGNKDDKIGTSYVNYDDENKESYDPSGENKFKFWMQIIDKSSL